MFLRKMISKQLAARGPQFTRPFTSRAGLNLFATSCAILGVFATSRGLANCHSALMTPSAGFVTSHAGLDVPAMLKTLKTDSTYNSSVVLYAASLLHDSELYKKTLAEFNIQLKKEPNNSFKAWMLGRLVGAAENINDKKAVKKAQRQLKILLKKDIAHDEFRAWSLGYLAALNSEEYQQNKEEMIKAANALEKAKDALEKPANALWAHVMNVQAAARANDETTFESILERMKQFTGKETVAEALAQIPANDWRAWAMGIVSESAALMGDKKLYQELSQPLSSEINKAVSNSTGNAILAQVSANTADTLMQSRQARALGCK